MKHSILVLLFGFISGANAVFALTRRSDGWDDWLGPALGSIAGLIMGIGAARRAGLKRGQS